ncbi:hypothetical protein [Enterococcus sp. DIV0187]|uniref:hypothetical protein n=1 Tax=Enterococcus sp. DIV0187 TaxID=2774644 RepID=UPI003F689732
MAIQSKFYKDLSKFEPIDRMGLTKRQRRMVFRLIPGTVAILSYIVFLDMEGIAFWILSIVTGSIFIVPPLLKGLGKWEEYSNKIEFFLKKQERHYETGQIRRYTADEFVQKKNVSETDKITKK